MNKINFGIVHLSVVPGRAEPSHRSEQVTQVLFGETFKVLRSEQDWHYIRNDFDAYECWIDGNQFLPLVEDHYYEYLKKSNFVNARVLTTINQQGGSSSQLIGIGANFPFYSGKHFKIGDSIYEVEHPPEDTLNTQASETRIIAIAESLLNTTYLWGGKSIMGMDCSGFTQLVFKCAGIKLPRDAYQQADMGYTLSFVAEARSGDLAFFDNDEGKIVHVGIVHGIDKIIHASGKVRIDRLDHQGIFNEDYGRYTHKLRLIKRII